MKPVHADRPFQSPIPPPKTRNRVVKILRPRPNSELRAVAINQELVAVYTHWHPSVDGKVRCLAEGDNPCPDECPDTDRRWYGYLPVLYLSSGRVACFEITHQAAIDCASISEKRLPLRGKHIILGRMGSGPFGRCYVRVEEYHRNVVLPPPEDAEEILNMVFQPCENGVVSRRRGRKDGGA